MIQETRQHILEILKTQHEATVDEIVEELHARTDKRVTAATVRHHLDVLRLNGLVEAPAVRRRDTPGRPQYVYRLTEKALDLFPNNYAELAHVLLEQLHSILPSDQVNVIIEGVADQMAADVVIPDVSMPIRLDYVTEFLNMQGYQASWRRAEDQSGWILSTTNCPFEKLSGTHDDLCYLDIRLMTKLLGVIPRRLDRIAEGAQSCDYYIPADAVSITE
ncbi:MAG: hypothetical protein CUN55_09615 [Phototrophicales bacterium]|nr:MAG: hypothetical protein CUN55_09615 [Phototrophicales bacterium]